MSHTPIIPPNVKLLRHHATRCGTEIAKPVDAHSTGARFVHIKRLDGGHVADFKFKSISSPRSIWLVLSAQEYVCKAT